MNQTGDTTLTAGAVGSPVPAAFAVRLGRAAEWQPCLSNARFNSVPFLIRLLARIRRRGWRLPGKHSGCVDFPTEDFVLTRQVERVELRGSEADV